MSAAARPPKLANYARRTRQGYARDLVPAPTVRPPRTVDKDAVERELQRLAELWPLGAEVRHENGRKGRIALDEAVRAPGVTAGKPTAWSLLSAGEAICVDWDNDQGLTWLVWVASHRLRLTGGRSR